MLKFINGKILSPDPLPEGYGILVEGNRIRQIAPADDLPHQINEINAGGNWVIPGLIDIHIHGSSGVDTMDPDPDSFGIFSRYLAEQGVTSFLPTTVTATKQAVDSVIKKANQFQQETHGARLLGLHLEGPYLQPKYRGAQVERYLRDANPEEYLPWLQSGLVKLVTVAPEINGVMDLIKTGTALGVNFAIGHSMASYDTVLESVEAGLNQATHTFNAMPPLHHREPGVLGAVLTDNRVFCQVIADGIHLHPGIVKLIFDAKGVERTLL